jgi:hypothetical protein
MQQSCYSENGVMSKIIAGLERYLIINVLRLFEN